MVFSADNCSLPENKGTERPKWTQCPNAAGAATPRTALGPCPGLQHPSQGLQHPSQGCKAAGGQGTASDLPPGLVGVFVFAICL